MILQVFWTPRTEGAEDPRDPRDPNLQLVVAKFLTCSKLINYRRKWQRLYNHKKKITKNKKFCVMKETIESHIDILTMSFVSIPSSLPFLPCVILQRFEWQTAAGYLKIGYQKKMMVYHSSPFSGLKWPSFFGVNPCKSPINCGTKPTASAVPCPSAQNLPADFEQRQPGRNLKG